VHPLAGRRPVAKTVYLQLEQVAVRVEVVERDRHAVIQCKGRDNAVNLQPDIRGQQIGERGILECIVVQASMRLLTRFIDAARPGQQRQTVVGGIVGQKRPTRKREGWPEAQHQSVPVDHLR
jgi:hypothetical protein